MQHVLQRHCRQGHVTAVMHVQMVYSSLPNFEEKEDDFRAESVLLRRRFTVEGARTAYNHAP